MKKMISVKRFALVAMALCLTTTFVACGDDDDPKPEDTKAVTDVNGSYTGKVSVYGQDADISATVSNSAVKFTDFPLTPLIAAVLGDAEAAAGLANLLPDFEYSAKFTPELNADKTAIELTFNPDPISIANVPVPSVPGVTGTVKVTLKSADKGQYVYNGAKLTFSLSVESIILTMGGSDLDMTPDAPLVLSFSLNQTK
jgi:hypothetical protein